MKSRYLSVGLILMGWALGCSPQPEERPLPAPGRGLAAKSLRFVDVTAQSGLDFVQVSGSPAQRYILEAMTGGVAFLDYDNDGYLDAFFVNGTRQEAPPPEAGNRLYHNVPGPDGNRVFRDVTDAAGLRHSGWGTGCATGDYDNDGDVDFFVAGWGPDLLYRNEGNGTFTDVTIAAGVGAKGWGASAAFGDLDLDGYLDLYVTHYLVFDPASPPNAGQPCRGYKGLETFCGPHGMTAQADVLYRNLGDGLFADMSAATGIDQYRYPGLGVVFTDYDGDGDPDIYAANDSQPNLLFRNDGNWRLQEVAAFAGVAYSEEGRSQAGMGVDAGDYDNDGDLDLFISNLNDRPSLLRNEKGNRQHWLGLKLVSRQSNREGIGARLKLSAGGRVQIREVLAGSSFLCSEDKRAHFGLGPAQGADSLTVHWPSGAVQHFAGLPGNCYLIVEEGNPAWRLARP